MASTDSSLHTATISSSDIQIATPTPSTIETRQFEFGFVSLSLPKPRVRDLQDALVPSIALGITVSVWDAGWATRKPPVHGLSRALFKNAVRMMPRNALVYGARGIVIQLATWGVGVMLDSDPRSLDSMVISPWVGAVCAASLGHRNLALFSSSWDLLVTGIAIGLFKSFRRNPDKESEPTDQLLERREE